MFLDKYRYAHINSNTTTNLATGPGVLHSIVVNTAGATDTVTAFDNTAASGTTIAAINPTTTLGSFIYDAGFGTGLTILTAGTTAPDITVTYLIG